MLRHGVRYIDAEVGYRTVDVHTQTEKSWELILLTSVHTSAGLASQIITDTHTTLLLNTQLSVSTSQPSYFLLLYTGCVKIPLTGFEDL